MSFLTDVFFPVIGFVVCVAVLSVGLQTYAQICSDVKFIKEKIEKITEAKNGIQN